jgi:hypothetical protein
MPGGDMHHTIDPDKLASQAVSVQNRPVAIDTMAISRRDDVQSHRGVVSTF